MNLSKSKYCNGIQCKKMLWLDKYKSEEKINVKNESVLDNGTEVGELAKNLFGEFIDIKFNENLQEMIKDTLSAINNNVCANITEASFNYSNNFCSVDILRKNKDKYEIYEVKSSTEVKDIYIEDASYQYYVLTSLGYDIKKVCIVHINKNYERLGELELNKLFNIVDITDIAKNNFNKIEKSIIDINKYMEKTQEPKDDIGMHCVSPYPCPFFKYCTKKLPYNNIFRLSGIRNSSKFKFYKDNKYNYEDLLNEKISDKVRMQIEFELYNKDTYINKKGIDTFLSKLSYPLYFLDFETYQQSIPEYDHVKPYMQIPFQYSLHYIEKENGKLLHKEFLAKSGRDPRYDLALRLVKDIPMNVITIAYNMMFEKTVIKNLAKLYPDLSKHLMNIHDNMVDLMIPFKNGDYYKKEMQGSYSIKYVLPALFPEDESLNYHNLDMVHNGSEAMCMYANIDNYSKEEQKKIRNNLLKYCKLDTLAMVKIWEKLKKL